MYLQDTVFDALKILVRISRDSQEKYQDQRVSYSPMSWIKEYCTIKASTSRRGGHTTSIIKLISDEDMNIGCLTRSAIMVKEFNRLYDDYNMSDRGSLEFCEVFNSCCNKSGYKMMGTHFPHLDAIVIDISFMLSKTQEDNIYRLALELQLARKDITKPFFIIFLQ